MLAYSYKGTCRSLEIPPSGQLFIIRWNKSFVSSFSSGEVGVNSTCIQIARMLYYLNKTVWKLSITLPKQHKNYLFYYLSQNSFPNGSYAEWEESAPFLQGDNCFQYRTISPGVVSISPDWFNFVPFYFIIKNIQNQLRDREGQENYTHNHCFTWPKANKSMPNMPQSSDRAILLLIFPT